MITEFSLENLNDTAARWDFNKLKYFNRKWMEKLDGKLLVDRILEVV